jgi:hypothetical protein
MRLQRLTTFQRVCVYVFGVMLFLMALWLILFAVAAATGNIE